MSLLLSTFLGLERVSCVAVFAGSESSRISSKIYKFVFCRWTKVFTTWGWVINDRIFHFWVNYPFYGAVTPRFSFHLTSIHTYQKDVHWKYKLVQISLEKFKFSELWPVETCDQWKIVMSLCDLTADLNNVNFEAAGLHHYIYICFMLNLCFLN